MNRKIKKFIAYSLSMAMISTCFVFTLNTRETVLANSTPIFDENSIVLSFGAMSDVHQNGSAGSLVEQKFRKAIKNLRSATNDKLDGLFFAGDLTDSGSEVQIKQFKQVISEEADLKTATVFSLGNHCSSNGSRAQSFYNILGERFYSNDVDKEAIEKANRHAVINGFDFLAIEVAQYGGSNGCSYTDANKKWLDNKLSELTAKDPNKPVFLATHPMLYDTVYGSKLGTTWYTKELTPILDKYPQVVTFSGHLHHPLNDPRSIMQTGFTSLGCASVSYMAIEGGYVETGSGTVPNDARNFSQGLLVEVDKDNNMRFRRMDFQNDREIGEPWVVPGPKADKSHLKAYTKDRANSNNAPVFNINELKASISGSSNINISFNKASDDEFVHHYDIEATRLGETTPQVVIKRLAPFYLKNVADIYNQTITGLTDGYTYEIKVYAVDSWGARSVPVSKTVEVLSTSLNPDKLVSDLFNFKVNENNRLVNVADGENYPFFNTDVSIQHDKTLNSKVLRFDSNKKSQVYFNLDKEKLSQITDDRGFSLDVYLKLNKLPKNQSDKMTLVSNVQNGIDLYLKDGVFCFDTQISGKSTSVTSSTKVEIDKYYQVSVSYDGKELSIFINGKKESFVATSGELTGFKDNESYKFSIGATQSDNKLTNILDGDIAKVRLFSHSLDPLHVAELNKMAVNNIDETVVVMPQPYIDVDFFADGTVKDSKNNCDFIQSGDSKIGETTVSYKDKEYQVNAFNVNTAGGNIIGTTKNIVSTADFSQFVAKGMTIEAFAVNKTPSGIQGIVCATQGGGYGLAYDNGKPYGLIETGGYVKGYSDAVASSKNLTHMVLTFDFDNSKLCLYIDGVLKATTNLGIQYKNTPESMFNKFVIGADLDTTGLGTDFKTTNFSIIDTKIYNNALTKKQVQQSFVKAEEMFGIVENIKESPAPLEPIDKGDPEPDPEPPKPVYKTGDVDRNGKISTVDVLLMLRYQVKLIDFDQQQLQLADIDKKNGVTSVDALLLLKQLAGLPINQVS